MSFNIQMRLLATILLVALQHAVACAETLTETSTGRDWAREEIGSETRQNWIRTWVRADSRQGALPGEMLELCLDQITSSESGKVPRTVANEALQTLTAWCFSEISPHLDNPAAFRGKTFSYP